VIHFAGFFYTDISVITPILPKKNSLISRLSATIAENGQKSR